MSGTRRSHTATLLPDGRVLVTGGYDGGTLTSVELYDRGLGFSSTWRPVLTTVTSPLGLGDRMRISGSGFRALSEASGSYGHQNSATNYPLVRLRRIDNEQLRWLRPDPATFFSNEAYAAIPIADPTTGHSLVTVFVNGIPSKSRIILVTHDTRVYLPLVFRN